MAVVAREGPDAIGDLDSKDVRENVVEFVLARTDAKVPRTSIMHLMAGSSFQQTALLRHVFEHPLDQGQSAEAIAAIRAVLDERENTT